jgi:dihydropteroate synthase type 2
VVPALHETATAISIDSFRPEVQRWAMAQGVEYLNDIHGFSDPSLYPELARASCKLIVMHRVGGGAMASRQNVPPGEIMDRITSFFEARLTALTGAGIAPERLILDPGMGFFLSTDPLTSFTVLENLPGLAAAFGLPLLVSVSRKSFLKALGPEDKSAAVELFAAAQGASYIRTHDPASLRDGLKVLENLKEPR